MWEEEEEVQEERARCQHRYTTEPRHLLRRCRCTIRRTTTSTPEPGKRPLPDTCRRLCPLDPHTLHLATTKAPFREVQEVRCCTQCTPRSESTWMTAVMAAAVEEERQ